MERIADNPLGRPALYYPYIHIRSEEWLKATLLCVPSIKRIVPEDYAPEDSPIIEQYSRMSGLAGPLLQAVPAAAGSALRAQSSLLAELRSQEDVVVSRFRRQPGRVDEYWIHDAKFNRELLDYLVERNLAWRSQNTQGYGQRSWYALHPRLGSAVMTTLGLAIAREQGLGIVTPSSAVHETLLATTEHSVFRALLNADDPEGHGTPEGVRRDLTQLVIAMSGVNLRALQPTQIIELHQSPNFRRFQRLLREKALLAIATQSQEDPAPSLRHAAEEIVETWREVQESGGSELRHALVEQAIVLSPEALRAGLVGSGAIELATAGTVAVGLLLLRAFTAHRERALHGGYQFLTEIHEAQDPALRLAFPLGL